MPHPLTLPLQVVARSKFYRKESRKLAVKEYFYGMEGGPGQLFPFSFDVLFSEVKIFKIGGETTIKPAHT